MDKKTLKTAYIGLLAALSLGIYALESLIPPLLPVPGIKPGLSNIITLYALRKLGKKEAALILTVRILLSGLLFGNVLSMAYSLAGGYAALMIELLCDFLLKRKHLYLTGAFGGLFHNIFQLIAAFFLMGSAYVFSYMPYLAISGILTGLFTGFVSHFLLKIRIPSES